MRLIPDVVAAVLLAVLAGCGEVDPVTPEPEPAEGALIVSNATAGGAFDLDGFEVMVDGAVVGPLELNDTMTLADVAEGPHTVQLNGLASNCIASHGTSRVVSVAGESAARLDFSVTCTPTPELASLRIVYARAFGHTSSLVAMNGDGGGVVELISGGYFYGPHVSPDGSRIVFMNDVGLFLYTPDIYVMNADGTGVTRLLAGPAYDPRWSPDGSEIVYSTVGGWWGGALHVMRADGSGSVQITGPDPFPEDAWPRWSPDGRRIAFTRDESPLEGGNHLSIWAVDRDGPGAERLTTPYGGAFPVWSAADGRIAFLGLSGGTIQADGIKVMNADGTDVMTLLETGPDASVLPCDWSPDGTLLLFTKSTGFERSDLFLLRVGDGSVVRLTADGARNITPTFW